MKISFAIPARLVVWGLVSAFAVLAWMAGQPLLAQTQSYDVSFVAGSNPGGLNNTADSDINGWTAMNFGGESTNQWFGPVAIPFPFTYFGDPVTQFRVSLNGLITFDTPPPGPPPSGNNTNLPSAGIPGRTIACFWDQFTPNPPIGSNDVIYWRVFGAAPNRQLWIKYFSFELGQTSFAYFSGVLEETTNRIYLVDMAWASGAASTTVGLQYNPTTAVQYADSTYNFFAGGSAVSDNRFARFTPYNIPAVDGELVRILAPSSGCDLSYGSSPVSIEVKNAGLNAVSSYQACYRINNNTPICENVAGTFPAGQVRTYNFNTLPSLPVPGNYRIRSWVTFPGDARNINDTLNSADSLRVKHPIPLSTTVGFEAPSTSPDSFLVVRQPNVQVVLSGEAARTGSFGLFFVGGTTTVGYLTPANGNEWQINEAFSGKAVFCVDATPATALRMSFDLRQQFNFNREQSVFRVLVNGVQVSPTYRANTTSSDPWQTHILDLTAFAGGRIVVEFEARNRAQGSTNFRDAAFLDNVRFFIPPDRDLRTLAIVSPPEGLCGDLNTPIEVAINNFGRAPQTNFPVRVQLVGGNTITTTYTGTLNPGQIDTVLVGTLDTRAGGFLSFRAWTDLSGEADRTNDTISRTIFLLERPATPFASFDTTVCGPRRILVQLPNQPNTLYSWYDTLGINANLIHNGFEYETGLLTDSVTYYLSSRRREVLRGGRLNNLVGSGSFSTFYRTQFMLFRVNQTLTLDSVRVYPSGTGVLQVDIYDSAGVNILQQSAPFFFLNPVADTVLFVNFTLQPGVYRIQANTNSTINSLFRNTSSDTYPYNIGTALTIINSNNSTFAYNHYYDWVVRLESCDSDTVPIRVNIPPTPVVNLGPDTLACSIFFLDAGNPGSTFLWSDGQMGQIRPIVSGGTYWVDVTSPAGCRGSDTLRVEIPDAPFVDLGSQDSVTVCGSLTLRTSNPPNFLTQWNTGATSQTLQVTQTGRYSVTVTNGCGVVAQDSIFVTVEPGAIFSLVPDTTVCVGEILVLDVTQPGNFLYQWSIGVTTPVVAITQPGTYWVNTFIPGGCVASDTIRVSYAPNPIVSLGPDLTSCSDVVLDAGNQPGLRIRWSDGSTAQTLPVSQSGTYWVEVSTVGGCKASDTIQVTISNDLTVNLGPDRVVCASRTTLNPGTQPSGATFLWSDGSTNATLEVVNGGTYWVRVTSPTGCVRSDTIRVAFDLVPQVGLGPDTTLCGTSYTIQAGNPFATYLWSTGATTGDLTVTQTGLYWVEVTYPCGPPVRDSIVVTLQAPPTRPFPSATLSGCDQLTLNAANPGSTYLWSTGATTAAIAVGSGGSYWVQITSPNGCTRRDTLGVEIFPTPQLNIMLPDTFFTGYFMQARAAATPFANSLSWNFGSPAFAEPNTSFAPTPVFRYIEPGTYTITVTGANENCISSATKTIVIVDSIIRPHDTDSVGSRAHVMHEPALRIYPVPTDGPLSIEIRNISPGAVRFDLLDAQGRMVLSEWEATADAEGLRTQIALDGLPSGVYLLRARTAGGVLTHPVVRQ